MGFESLVSALTILLIPIASLYIFSSFKQSRAVKGSHQRYVATTMMVGASLGMTLVFLARAALNLGLDDRIGAGWDLTLAGVYAWMTYRALKDDNWFNNQWKRLKRGLKRLRQRLANSVPLPSPSPA